jgi:hypothetical protein
VPVELELRVAVSAGRHRFILHRQAMHLTEAKVVMLLVAATLKRCPAVASLTMGKGYRSPRHRRAMAEAIDLPVLPEKDRCLAG